MKKLILPMLSVLAVILFSCQRDPVERPPAPVADRVLGKWKLLRFEEDDYDPINSQPDHTEYIGQPDDSLVFKNNHTVISYSSMGEEEVPYQLVNDSTISVDDEEYKIRKLTDTEFNLHLEETDLTLDEKYVVDIFLHR